jgi:serine/threonine protein kinase
MTEHEKIQKIFSEAIALPEIERAAFLHKQCGTDEALRAELDSLLENHNSKSDELEQDWSDLPTIDSKAGAPKKETSSAPRSHPKQIGDYKVIRVLGEGGMGITYEAVQKSPKRRVAIKVIKADGVTESSRRRFEYEASALARLTHPGIAQIYESGAWIDSDGAERLFIAMEYVNGGPLTGYVRKHELSTKERLILFRSICEAVHHSHQKGIIHRDLKPDNILIRKDGQPKIIDFGVARPTDRGVQCITEQTNVGRLIGTLQYMSPEQVDAVDDDLDIRSDVYALGVVMYEMLCGTLPYNIRQKALSEAIRVIQEDPPTSPSTIHRTLRGDIETITLKALEKNRNRRYGSAEDLANDIRRYLENDPIEARPPSLLYRAGKFSRKHRAAAVAMLVVFLSIVIGGTVSTIGWQEASFQQARVEVRNEVLQESVMSLLHGVKEAVQDLGDSADAQRALLGLAGKNLNAIQQGQTPTKSEQVELAIILIRSARSHMSVSGVGFGDLDEAAISLTRAEEVLDSIDLQNAEASLRTSVSRIILDRLKYVAELQTARAAQTDDEIDKKAFREEAMQVYLSRDAAGKRYYKTSNDWKGIDVQQSSQLGLGNVLLALGDEEGANDAFAKSLEHAKSLMKLVPDKSSRWQRNIAVSKYSLARVSTPKEAIQGLHEGIAISRSLVTLESNHVRRPRDLAIMLALRGKLRLTNGYDEKDGIADLQEAALMFTKRAVQSPQETTTQQDYEENISQMADELMLAGLFAEGTAMLAGAINQLACIASAQELAGRLQWKEIVEKLQTKLESFATASVPE